MFGLPSFALRRTESGNGARTNGSRFVADDRGATVIEFAMVAVPLFSLLIAALETALISFSQQQIETAAETAARTITTGRAQSASMTQQQFHDATCATLPNYLSCAKLIVDVQRASSFSAVTLSTPTITYDSSGKPVTAYAIGGAGDIVIVRAMYLWPLPTLGFGLKLNNVGATHLLIGVNVAKTESYN